MEGGLSPMVCEVVEGLGRVLGDERNEERKPDGIVLEGGLVFGGEERASLRSEALGETATAAKSQNPMRGSLTEGLGEVLKVLGGEAWSSNVQDGLSTLETTVSPRDQYERSRTGVHLSVEGLKGFAGGLAALNGEPCRGGELGGGITEHENLLGTHVGSVEKLEPASQLSRVCTFTFDIAREACEEDDLGMRRKKRSVFRRGVRGGEERGERADQEIPLEGEEATGHEMHKEGHRQPGRGGRSAASKDCLMAANFNGESIR